MQFDAVNFKGFSFGGGGMFTLVAPQLAMGGAKPAQGAWLGLDFLQKTGFGGLDLSTFRSRVVDDLFAGGIGGGSAFLDTTRFVVGAGETLNLSQALLPNFVDPATATRLTSICRNRPTSRPRCTNTPVSPCCTACALAPTACR